MTAGRFNHLKISAVFLLLILLAGAGVFWFASKKSGKIQTTSENLTPHHAVDPAVSLASIEIKAFYFVPSDAVNRQADTWQQDLQNALAQMVKFYVFQLHQASRINFKIYPQVVYGQRGSAYYDGTDTSRGNQHALLKAREELVTRALTAGGDIYDPGFATADSQSLRVLAILYEGVGGSATLWLSNPSTPGSDAALSKGSQQPVQADEWPAFLVSREYLTQAAYQDNGATIFAHEFGHILGFSDSYDPASGEPTSDDLMGSGRFRPLSITYLSADLKKSLGLAY